MRLIDTHLQISKAMVTSNLWFFAQVLMGLKRFEEDSGKILDCRIKLRRVIRNRILDIMSKFSCFRNRWIMMIRLGKFEHVFSEVLDCWTKFQHVIRNRIFNMIQKFRCICKLWRWICRGLNKFEVKYRIASAEKLFSVSKSLNNLLRQFDKFVKKWL